MEKSQWEVIIVKPTTVFLSYLAKHFPHIELPELSILQADATAYTMRRQPSEEQIVQELERHYATIFRHEISRTIDAYVAEEVETSFLDFLRCFKFELHSQVVLMEPSIMEGHQLLCIKPRSVLIKWMQTTIEDQNEMISILERVNVGRLAEDTTVVVKNFHQLTDVKPFINHHFKPIYHAEMERMCDKADQWPEVDSLEEFNRYFAVEVHTQLMHLQ